MNKTIGAISLYGSKREIEAAEEALNELDTDLSEGEIRPLIQEIIDQRKLKAAILYDGNSVWSKQRIIRNLRQIVKAGVLYREDRPRLSKYFYEFLHLCCGSIAHYNINGWVAEYPTVEDLRAFFLKNEFGRRVLDHLPEWKTDVKIIVREIEGILGI
ncbi:MAG: hypothetical protein KAT53_04795 [Dehalococcoidia bacterium]|nr:hypothetical protein [Dehalococcoidia bacterium]